MRSGSPPGSSQHCTRLAPEDSHLCWILGQRRRGCSVHVQSRSKNTLCETVAHTARRMRLTCVQHHPWIETPGTVSGMAASNVGTICAERSQTQVLVPLLLQRLHCPLDFLLPVIVNILDLLGDLLEQLLRKDPQQRPSDVQRRENVPVLVGALAQEPGLELVRELQVLVLIFAKCLLAHNGLHGTGVLANGVVRVELVRDVGVVSTRHALADTGFHEAAERRQNIDGRVDLPVVQGPVHKDLALGDVAREIRDRVRDVVIWHGQDRKLRDRTVAALDATRTLVDG
mmetsp:Transcript_52457/g.145440  ORF Transcript_52457/g.145440 Transcript_52457/m.145440 type:complete len:286 (+) Transcript_52457:113-970(+)